MVLARRDSRLSSRDSRLSRRETRCGNLLLSGTVESHQLGQTKIFKKNGGSDAHFLK